MNKCIINFKVKDYSIENKLLEVSIRISNYIEKEVIQLFKGKISPLNIHSNVECVQEGQYIYLNNIKNEPVSLTYKVNIGNGGKHGLAGNISNDFIAFAGEQVFLFPVDVLTIDDRKASKFIITMEYEFSSKYNSAIVPFDKIINDRYISICQGVKWMQVYELMKSCYAFGNFSTIDYAEKDKGLKIFVNSKNETTNNQRVFDEIERLYDYYLGLFDYNNKEMSVVLFDKVEDDKYVLGGCGRNIIGATFDHNNKRDWQLLSHRFFHGFMDSKLTIRDFHMPPTLWVTEGLATYYENMALESLSKEVKDMLKIDTLNEFQSLYKRYLYMLLKDPCTFSIAPMEEAKLRSNGKSEFLHYTQAPLLIKFMEDVCYSKTKKKNNIIEFLLNLNIKEDFIIKDLFKYVLGSNLDTFSMNFLFKANVLPMWNLECIEDENVSKIVDELNYFEYVMWTWLAADNSNYVMDEMSIKDLNKLCRLAEEGNVNFASEQIEELVMRMSPTVYKLLKQHALRAKVCGVVYNDRDLRFKLIGYELNISKWKEFKENNNYIKNI